ncbi:Alpha/beta hydrolase fold-3 [Metarhizium album ARSEF 1941]|uniref:Alpha/beta hydrolase fold-3 n=1 Tax=Metarhizium album (strain ARSEF 1941) TaxID=1081103 RepID=A0A0B2X4K7_METAS|nr:Alpha/beta hydrolase fold-3 [Metarhizium album ARSEF 1941]KHO00688.1 Alpha/beta hydrolase fold-3 [Metarhizium album ARSEF 1941]
MILRPVSLLDCAVAAIIITPQIFYTAGPLGGLAVVIRILPFLCEFSPRVSRAARNLTTSKIVFRLPFYFLARYVKPRDAQPWFIAESSLFEDMMIRIVRYGFTNLPVKTVRVLFTKHFAYPFLRWRMFRSGHFKFPAHLQENFIEQGNTSVTGLWIKHDPGRGPDVVVYYIHGGGFALGSCYFYLEFLLAMHHLLLKAGFENPAIFALEYSLAPEKTHPTQVNQAVLGYRHILEEVGDASKVCIAGDSAGGTLTLSLLLQLGKNSRGFQSNGSTTLAVPKLAVLISPWITLVSNTHYPSELDYLERDTLWKYGRAYGGSGVHDYIASPGLCQDGDLWTAVSPQRGYFIVYGEEETLAPDAEAFVRHQRRNNIEIDAMEFKGGIHAWPVASLMLSGTRDRRLQGLESIVRHVRKKFSDDAFTRKKRAISDIESSD